MNAPRGQLAGAPERLGPYHLHEIIGGGGTAIVYRATDSRTGEAVAIKELRPQFADHPSARRRFLVEAHVARSLDHPGVVRVLDAGEQGGRPFLVMELVQGETLRALLDRLGPLGDEVADRLVAALAETLHHAHTRGVIHRDLKPHNVFLVGPPSPDVASLASDPQLEARVKLGDFGQARVTALASMTGASLAWGTPEYMPPEAFKRARLDPRSDLFSLGVLLHELTTGRLPWTRSQALARIALAGGNTAPVPPSGAAHDPLIAELLAPAPADRPETAAVVRARLRGAPARALVVPALCPACGQRMEPDLPLCLSCGQTVVLFSHRRPAGLEKPPGRGLSKGGWRLVLVSMKDDAQTLRSLLDLLGLITLPVDMPILFLTEALNLYSPEERRNGISLPAVLLNDLDEETARALERLFRARGLDAEARRGFKRLSFPKPGWGHASGGIAFAATAVFMCRIFDSVWAGLASSTLILAGAGLVESVKTQRRFRRSSGLFRLRERAVSVPGADEMLASLVAAVRGLQAPEARRLVADVAAALYRLSSREAPNRNGATPAPGAPLAQRLLAVAPQVAAQVKAIAERLTTLEDELRQGSEAELLQLLARLERRVTVADERDRHDLAAGRRDLEEALDRRHRQGEESERMSGALCALLAHLRDACEQVERNRARQGEEDEALEVACRELDAFLARPGPLEVAARPAGLAPPPVPLALPRSG